MINIEVKDASKLLSKLDDLKNCDFTDAINTACILVENEAKLLCPVGDTGLLRSSITHEVNDNVGQVGTNVEYAPYVEFGTGLFAEGDDGRKDVPWSYYDAEGKFHITSGQHPKPFLRPAFNNNRVNILDLICKRIEEVI